MIILLLSVLALLVPGATQLASTAPAPTGTVQVATMAASTAKPYKPCQLALKRGLPCHFDTAPLGRTGTIENQGKQALYGAARFQPAFARAAEVTPPPPRRL